MKNQVSPFPQFQEAIKGLAYNIQLPKNFKVIVSGGSGSGKSTLCREILRRCHELMEDPPKEVFYYYQIYQKELFDGIKSDLNNIGIRANFIQGTPSDEELESVIESKVKPAVLILDDLQQQLTRGISNVFNVGSSHARISISKYVLILKNNRTNIFPLSVLMVQNLFDKNPHLRNCSLSATSIILTKSVRDQTQIFSLGRQLMPSKGSSLVKIFQESTREPFSHLMIDLRQTCPEYLRLRGNMFCKGGEPVSVYVLEDEMRRHLEKNKIY